MKSTSKTKYAILGILTIKPMSGYEIKKMIDSSIAHFWNESFGQLYPALSKMAEEELISVTSENVGSKPKNIYSITEKGITILREWLALSSDTEQVRLESLLKIFFGYNTDISVTISHINEMKIAFQQKLIVLREIVKGLEQYNSPNKEHLFPLLTAQYGIFNYEANLKWADYALKSLDKLKNSNKEL